MLSSSVGGASRKWLDIYMLNNTGTKLSWIQRLMETLHANIAMDTVRQWYIARSGHSVNLVKTSSITSVIKNFDFGKMLTEFVATDQNQLWLTYILYFHRG